MPLMCVSCQLVTTIPTRRLPKKLVLGEIDHEEIKQMEKGVEDDQPDEAGQRGQYLWIRGLTRLQHQVNLPRVVICVVRLVVGVV